MAAANSRQLNVTDFPTRDVMTSVSDRHCNLCQESLAEDVPFFFLFFFFCSRHSWHMCRLYYQQSPGLQGTHGNWLSGLAPSLQLTNAYRPRPADVTFPDEGKKEKEILLSTSCIVFSSLTFCLSWEVLKRFHPIGIIFFMNIIFNTHCCGFQFVCSLHSFPFLSHSLLFVPFFSSFCRSREEWRGAELGQCYPR